MKTTSLFLLLLFPFLSAHSQNANALQTASKKLYQANYLMDFEAITTLSYPKMVSLIGKEKMAEQLEKHYENEEYRLREQLETLPLQIGPVKKINETSFCVIRFRNPLRYFFESKLTTVQAAEKKAWLQEQTQSKDVTFEPSRNSFNVRRQTIYIAIMDESTSGDWKFINLDDSNQRTAFQNLFDEATRKQLGL